MRGGRARGWRCKRFGKAKVQHLRGPVGSDLYVCRLQVAVDDSLFVRRLERLGDLPGEREGFIERETAVDDAIGERWALDQLHHQRDGPVLLFEAVNLRDMGMIQRRQNFGFALEAG